MNTGQPRTFIAIWCSGKKKKHFTSMRKGCFVPNRLIQAWVSKQALGRTIKTMLGHLITDNLCSQIKNAWEGWKEQNGHFPEDLISSYKNSLLIAHAILVCWYHSNKLRCLEYWCQSIIKVSIHANKYGSFCLKPEGFRCPSFLTLFR